MTPELVRREISDLVTGLLELGLALDGQTPMIDERPGYRRVTWPKFRAPIKAGPPSAFGFVGEYRYLLENRQFICVMSDGALLQLTYEFQAHSLNKHSLCFYPCPFHVAEDDSQTLPLLDLLDIYIDDEFNPNHIGTDLVGSRLRGRSPIRFDFDMNSATEDHAASHIHWEQHGCRWPVFGPLSVGHFVRFVFRHFYENHWAEHKLVRDWPLRSTGIARTVTTLQERSLYVDWKDTTLIQRFLDHVRG